MGSSKSASKEELEVKTTVDDDMLVKLTVMAIREEIMQYFKGGCVEKLTQNTNVRLRRVHSDVNYNYERLEMDIHRPSRIWIGQVPIMSVESAPDKMTFHKVTLSRSKQFRRIMQELEEFASKYLQGVERIYEDATITK